MIHSAAVMPSVTQLHDLLKQIISCLIDIPMRYYRTMTPKEPPISFFFFQNSSGNT